MTAILEPYRKTIVLLEDGRTLDVADQSREETAGRLLYQQKHQALSTLSDALAADVSSKPARLERIHAFLDRLETHPDLRDADKLAFRDIVDDVIEALPRAGSPELQKLRARLDDDAKALTAIQALYQKELEKIFGRFETRGMTVRREGRRGEGER